MFPFGTTGEFYAYDQGFYDELLAVTKDAVAGRMQIYAGANHITTKGAVKIAKAVEKVGGIDALSVLTPIKGGLAGSTVMNAKAPMMMDQNFQPGFRIDLHIKDLTNVVDAAKAVDAPIPLT